MAETVNMGEVEELHSKEDGAIVNGDVTSDVDMENEANEEIKKVSQSEEMEVDDPSSETTETKEANSTQVESNGMDDSVEEIKEIEDKEEENINDDEEKDDDDDDEKEEEDEDKEDEEDDNNQSENSENNCDSVDNDNDIGGESNSDEKEETGDIEKASDKIIIEEISENKSVDGDDVHEIDDNDDHDESSQASSVPSKTASESNTNSETIELNDSGGEDDGDVMIVDVPKENGTDSKKVTEVIDLETPEKKEKPKGKDVTPRRSSRNLNKSKSYCDESDKEEEVKRQHSSEESDIEEVTPQDPLAVSDAVTIERIPMKKTPSSTIVVKDTKRLVEIAAKSSNTSSKKEPTLVIIDTNSILSGRGAVPVNNKPTISTSAYTPVLPMALPAQGMYPANMRATITPIPSTNNVSKSSPVSSIPAVSTPLLPTLTDDMYVVEAPSFIVPYVYEKPPVKDFKEFLSDYMKLIQQQIKEEEEEERKKNKAKNREPSPEPTPKTDKSKKKKGDDDTDYNIDEEKDVDSEEESAKVLKKDPNKPSSYFDSPLGKFFSGIGFNLVQEYVQSDLLRQQKRKRDREGGQNKETEKTIHSLIKNLEFSKENNEPFKMQLRKCELCNFKTESSLALAYHLETPHMKNFVYRCNFCTYEVRSPHDILFHMEAEHTVRGHLERAPAFHQCSNCPFEDNQKGKLSRHLVACTKKFKPERNLEPPVDWEPPAKIPRVPKMRQQGLNATAAAYQAMSKNSQYQFLSKMQLQSTQQPAVFNRGRGRPPTITNTKVPPVLRSPGMVFSKSNMSGGSVLVPTNYQVSGNQVYQVVGGQELGGRLGNPGHMSFVPNIPSASSSLAVQQPSTKKPLHQPSISITPLPRSTTSSSLSNAAGSGTGAAKPGDNNSKNSFVICEICDGYIKDLEQLRNHMQWIHKIKIHPKMIYNRPPLNCQKCQFRFFTDQGLERHLLGSHGLVTSSMQDAANKSKDSGRCPVCGRVYQWKLLNHVARDHNMTLKPAHLSYKCTVCTATFGMYKQFENHVYSAHSVVAKRAMDKKSASASPSSSAASAAKDLKPLKINDEITIIPQPLKTSKEGSPSTSKNEETTPASSTRAERLARRNAIGGDA
ncbi:MOG interacting and ectopic P-granules protein 1 isoform X3 [Aethina tumida]|nr:MOG interacting and ectopic P-granules protein 1 isoform X3 [Aethina tumida]